MTTPTSANMKIAELNRRLLAGEEVSTEEIKEGIQLLRGDRAARTEAKQAKVKAAEKQAIEGEDLLGKL